MNPHETMPVERPDPVDNETPPEMAIDKAQNGSVPVTNEVQEDGSTVVKFGNGGIDFRNGHIPF